MGYIVPIIHYQYNQYAERVILKQYDPFQFVPIKPIKPAVNPPETYLMSKSFPQQNLKNTARKNPPLEKQQKIDSIYGEITGKGLLFSEYA